MLDPASGRSGRWDLALAEGKVIRVAREVSPQTAREVVDAEGCYVVPGLIDLHTHIYWGVSAISVDVEALWRTSGVTTWVDAGSAGAATFPGFRRFIMERAPVRILAFLNISTRGILGVTVVQGVPGECDDIRWCDLGWTLRVLEENRDRIVGVKVRAGRHPVGQAGIEPLQIAREAADAAGVPMMVHAGPPPPALREVMPLLREGDILTHSFRGPVPSILTRDGRIRPDVLEARERGVLVDVGHGGGSLDFGVARRAMGQGFLPDTISTDLHTLNLRGPVFDMVTTLSKFLNLGLSVEEVVARATWGPACALNLGGGAGTLQKGARGDVTLLSLEKGNFTFQDAVGNRLEGDRRLVVEGTVVGGTWVPLPGNAEQDEQRIRGGKSETARFYEDHTSREEEISP